MAITKVSKGMMSFHGRKNAIINGNFDIWQRGTTISVTGSGEYYIDRWKNGSNTNLTASRQSFTPGQTDVPNEPSYYARLTRDSVEDEFAVQQAIEDVRTFAGKIVTLSFYARASKTLTGDIQFNQVFGSGGSGTVAVSSQTLNLTTSWQKFTYTFTLPSISGKTIGTDSNLLLAIAADITTGTISDYFDLAQVQLEEGNVATDFERRTIGEELVLCQRYFEILGKETGSSTPTIGQAISSTQALGDLQYSYKRIIPTIAATTASNFGLTNATNGGITVTSISFAQITQRFARISFSVASGLSAGNATQMYHGNASAEITIDAEL